MTEDNSTNPLRSTKTLVLTAAGVLQWLDLEIDYLKDRFNNETSELARLVLTGTALHLEVMKEQFTNYAMQELDKEAK
jgi:hypothetical protein